jgi:hypothetical protein
MLQHCTRRLATGAGMMRLFPSCCTVASSPAITVGSFFRCSITAAPRSCTVAFFSTSSRLFSSVTSSTRVRPPDVFDLPPPANPKSQEEFEALRLKGYDGHRYDMMASYQLGQIFFDGINPTAATTSATSSATSSFASDSGASFSQVPWSLPRNYSQSLLWFTNAAFEGHGEKVAILNQQVLKCN